MTTVRKKKVKTWARWIVVDTNGHLYPWHWPTRRDAIALCIAALKARQYRQESSHE